MSFYAEFVGSSVCEWKGRAGCYSIEANKKRAENAAWFYRNPAPAFDAIKNYVAFYPSKMDACYIDDELATSQDGDCYGGWITSEIVGPFRGAAGTWGLVKNG